MKILPLRIACLTISLFLLLTPTVSFCEIIEISIKGIDDGKRTTKQKDYTEAVLFAKMQALERAGVEMKSKTTVKDLVLQQDLIESKSEVVLLPGYQIVDIGYVADGTYQVVLVGKLKTVKDFDANGVGQVSDVLGWDLTRWGMTKAEVREVYKGAANAVIFDAEDLNKSAFNRAIVEQFEGKIFLGMKENKLLLVNYFRTGPPGKFSVTLPQSKKLVFSNELPVSFGFNNENKLEGISMLKVNDKLSEDDTLGIGYGVLAIESSFNEMEKQLMVKYGDCKIKKDSGDRIEHIWTFPSTIIKLTYVKAREVPFMVILSYEKPTVGY